MSASSKNRVLMTVSGHPGTGTVTVNAAVTGYQAFSSSDNGNTFTVTIYGVDGQGNPNGLWEVQNLSSYTHSTKTLTRSAPNVEDSSSGAGTLVNFSSGNIRVFVGMPASLVSVLLTGNQGDVIYRGSSGWSRLSPGTSGQVLTTGGASANPSWTTVSGGGGGVTSFNTRTGAVTLTSGDVTTALGDANIAYTDAANHFTPHQAIGSLAAIDGGSIGNAVETTPLEVILDVEDISTFGPLNDVGTVAGALIALKWNPANDTYASVYGCNYYALTDASNTKDLTSAQLIGVFGLADHNGVNTIFEVGGGELISRNMGNGNVTFLYGNQSGAQQHGSGTSDNGIAQNCFVGCFGGTITLAQGCLAQINSFSPGSITTAQAVYAQVGGPSGTVGTGYGVYVDSPGAITTANYGIYVTDQSGSGAANTYYEWFDSQGVRRVKEDSTFNSVGQAIEALHNPQFTKYTLGTADYERIILGQWVSNVGEIGIEKGGTGTFRQLRLIGNGVQISDSDSSAIDSSARFQVDSTTQGFAPPRGTTTQKNAISSPLESLYFYDTTLHAPYYWNGSAWTPFGSTYTADESTLHLSGSQFSIISTYVGQTSITTLGTIGTGTWQGAVVGSAYGGTGVNNAGRTITINTNSGTLDFTASSKTVTVQNSTTLNGGTHSGTNTGDQDLSGYLTISSAASSYQPLDAALTALAAGSDFVQFTGPTTSTKVFTLPNATCTILTSNSVVTVAQGGTGLATLTAHALYAGNGTSAPTAVGPSATTGAPLVSQGSSSDPAFSATGVVVNSSSGTITADSDGSTITFNCATSNLHQVTLGGNRTLALSGDVDSQRFVIVLKQDGTGGRTVTWWSGIRWQNGVVPTLTPTASQWDVFSFIRMSSGVYLGFAALNF